MPGLSSLANRLSGSADFRRRAAAFPLTRPIAHHRARALFGLVTGFAHTQILVLFTELRLQERFADGPRAAAGLAAELGLPEERLDAFLSAAASLGLLRRRGAAFNLGPLGAALIDNPAVLAMIAHNRLLYDDLRDPLTVLRGARGEGRLASFWDYAGDGPENRKAGYAALMAQSQALVAEDVVRSWRFARHRHLLDIGGGTGAFLLRAAAAAPRLAMTLFDLPAMASLARAHLSGSAAGARITVAAGDFTHDPLPQGADIATLIRILHDHDDATVSRLLRAARAALPPGGTLLVAEPMKSASASGAAIDAYFTPYLLAMGGGRPRSAKALSALLTEAGFSRPRLLKRRMELFTSVLVATA